MPKKKTEAPKEQTTFVVEPQVRIVVAALVQQMKDVVQGELPLGCYAWVSYRIADNAPMAGGLGTAEVASHVDAVLRGVVAALEYAFVQEIPTLRLQVASQPVADHLLDRGAFPYPTEDYVQGRILAARKALEFSVEWADEKSADVKGLYSQVKGALTRRVVADQAIEVHKRSVENLDRIAASG
jgi:hypothetical protein